MAFTFTNYAAIPPQQSPLHDLIGNLLSGYTDTTKAQFLRPGLEEQLRKAQLENKWYEPNIQSQIGLRGAQAGHLGSLTSGQNITNKYLPQKLRQEQDKRAFELQNPFFGQTGASGDLGRLLYLQQMVKNNPELASRMQQQLQEQPTAESLGEQQSYMPSIQQQAMPQQLPQQQPFDSGMNWNQAIQNAMSKIATNAGGHKEFAPSPLGKYIKELSVANTGINPVTNEPFVSPQEQKKTVHTYKEKLGGLKGDQHYIYDKNTDEPIGIKTPYTAKERENEKGSILFNEFFPDINAGLSQYIGKDSVKNFNNDVNKYGKDLAATKRIDDLLYAEKLHTAGVINEQATLNAGKTNVPYQNIRSSFPKTDIPNLIQRYEKELKLPKSAFNKANTRFQEKINSGRAKAQRAVPHYQKQYFHPERHLITKHNSTEKGTYNNDPLGIRR